MSKSTSSRVRKVIAYFLAVLVLAFSVIAILAIWDVINYQYMVRRMFQSLMVIMAASAVIVLIFAILDRPEREET